MTPEPNPFFAAHNPTTLPPIPSRLPSPRPFLRMFPQSGSRNRSSSNVFKYVSLVRHAHTFCPSPSLPVSPFSALFFRIPSPSLVSEFRWAPKLILPIRCVLNPKCFLCLSLRSKTLYYVKPATRDACVALLFPFRLDPICPPSHGVLLCAFVCLPNLSLALLSPLPNVPLAFSSLYQGTHFPVIVWLL